VAGDLVPRVSESRAYAECGRYDSGGEDVRVGGLVGESLLWGEWGGMNDGWEGWSSTRGWKLRAV